MKKSMMILNLLINYILKIINYIPHLIVGIKVETGILLSKSK